MNLPWNLKRPLRACLIAIALGLAGAAAPALAARSCPELAIDAWTADTPRDARQCLADLNERLDLRSCVGQPWCQGLAQWRDLPTPQMLATASGQVLAVRDRLARSIATEGLAEAEPTLRGIDRFQTRLRDVTLEQLQPAATGPLATGAASSWALDTASFTVRVEPDGELALGILLDQECAVSAARCSRTLRGGAAVVAAYWQMNVVANAMLRDKRNALVAHVAELDARWNRYFAASRSQFPWELALNSHLYTKGRRNLGLVGPPEEQWAFLHPTVGLRYRSGAESRYDSALVLELVGYQQWRWSGSEMTGLRGGALVAAWTDRNKRDRPAIGVVYHMGDNYSLGVMHDSGSTGRRTTLLLSADLGKLFLDPKAVKDKLLGR